MQSLWTKMRSQIDNNGLSRDFIHLTQRMGSDGKSVKYGLAVILEKCIADEDYKDTAIKNLVGLAKDDAQLRKCLEYFSFSKDSAYKGIKPIAEEVISKMNKKPFKAFL